MLFSQLDPSQCSQFFIQAPLQRSGKDFSKKNLLFHDLLILLFSACFKCNWATSEHCLSPMLCTVSTWAWVLIPIGNFPSPDLKTWVPIHGPFCEPSLRQIKKISGGIEKIPCNFKLLIIFEWEVPQSSVRLRIRARVNPPAPKKKKKKRKKN